MQVSLCRLIPRFDPAHGLAGAMFAAAACSVPPLSALACASFVCRLIAPPRSAAAPITGTVHRIERGRVVAAPSLACFSSAAVSDRGVLCFVSSAVFLVSVVSCAAETR